MECAETTTGERCGGYERMSLYSFSGTPTPVAPTMTSAPQPVTPCDTFTEEGCYVDSTSDRIMTQVVSDPNMSAEVRL